MQVCQVFDYLSAEHEGTKVHVQVLQRKLQGSDTSVIEEEFQDDSCAEEVLSNDDQQKPPITATAIAMARRAPTPFFVAGAKENQN